MHGLLTDYHTHTPRCKHAAGPMEAYVEHAIARGLKEVGFSDHNPLPDGLGANVRMAESELDAYVEDVLRLRERYRDAITVRLGLEMDYVEGREAYLEQQAARHPWDYIIGSVHYLDAACREIAWPRQFTGDPHTIYARYYARIAQLVATGFYDIVAHFDLPKRMGRPATPREAPLATAALQAIARAGIAMEINTSGFRHPELSAPEAYPTPALVTEAIALGIPICVNSDAHAPDHVGQHFERIAAELPALGCRDVVRFARRKPTRHPLA